MSDRELLELAARAAGHCMDYMRWDGYRFVEQKVHGVPHCGLNYEKTWNPLTDDGDALRLAVKLHISPSWSPSKNSVKAAINNNPFLVFGMDATGDDCADIRRIIVMSAASIWEAMQ